MITATMPEMGRQKKPYESVQVRIPRTLWLKLRSLAGDAGLEIGEYIAKTFEPEVDRQLLKLADRIKRDIVPKGSSA